MEEYRSPIFDKLEDFEEFVDLISLVLTNKRIYRTLTNESGSTLFVGDIHGFFNNAVNAVKLAEKMGVANLVFLGDYADRGPQQLKSLLNIIYAFALSEGLNPEKIYPFIDPVFAHRHPFKIIALRGNHENVDMNKGDFENELRNIHQFPRFPEILLSKIYDNLPIMVETKNKSLAVHGGIPKPIDDESYLSILDFMKGLYTPVYRHPLNNWNNRKVMIMRGFLWNDPQERLTDEGIDFEQSFRGYGIHFFSESALDIFFSQTGLRKLIRAHDSLRGAYESVWNGKLIHIFSSYPYFDKIKQIAYYLEYEDGTGDFLNEKGEILRKNE